MKAGGKEGARVGWLQTRLEATYDIEVPHAVDDFVISSRAMLATLLPHHAPAAREELLFVEGPGDRLDIGLFLDEELLTRLVDDHPEEALHEGNLEHFCVALEGVSHFLYVLWKSARDRNVTQLELELQAEVDKYFTTTMLFAGQNGRLPDGLVERLFGAPTYLEHLDEAARERYETANRYAAKLSLKLEKRFLRKGSVAGAVQALRRFYRLNGGEKLRYIEQV